MRRAKTTSMGLAVNAVKSGDAGAAVSGGNTGALMAMSKLALRTMPGIDRPALAALMPDAWAKTMSSCSTLAPTRIAMPAIWFSSRLWALPIHASLTGRDKPRVRLLNIGTEEIKGTDEPAGCCRHAATRQRVLR